MLQSVAKNLGLLTKKTAVAPNGTAVVWWRPERICHLYDIASGTSQFDLFAADFQESIFDDAHDLLFIAAVVDDIECVDVDFDFGTLIVFLIPLLIIFEK